jgi:cob(I)alamin adenosyltransferase
MAKIYTRTGDRGETSLLSGGRVAKDHPRVEAYGTLDELSSTLGLLLCEAPPEGAARELAGIQATLFAIGSILADPDGRLSRDEGVWRTEPIERWIDAMDADLEPLDAFILPGGSRGAALAHVARTICRRAERRVRAAADPSLPTGVLAYLNRLSDALFVLARWLNAQIGVEETRWTGGSGSA